MLSSISSRTGWSRFRLLALAICLLMSIRVIPYPLPPVTPRYGRLIQTQVRRVAPHTHPAGLVRPRPERGPTWMPRWAVNLVELRGLEERAQRPPGRTQFTGALARSWPCAYLRSSGGVPRRMTTSPRQAERIRRPSAARARRPSRCRTESHGHEAPQIPARLGGRVEACWRRRSRTAANHPPLQAGQANGFGTSGPRNSGRLFRRS